MSTRSHRRHPARSFFTAGAAAVGLMAGASPVLAAHGVAGQLAAPARMNQIIIQFKPGAAGASGSARAAIVTAREIAARRGLSLKALRRNAFDAVIVRLDRFESEEVVAQLARDIMAADASVDFAEPDRILRPAFTPNDTHYPLQWHYQNTTAGINLPAAWELSTGTGVKVAVIDTGYRPHADLAANIVGGYDMISDTWSANDGGGRDASALDPGDWTSPGDCDWGWPGSDSSWHGTHVAGTVAATTHNGVGVAGVAYGAKVVPVRVLGRCGGTSSDIADAITWASGGSVPGVPANLNPARVLNLSLGGEGSCDQTTQQAITAARSRKSVVVVAAGNSNMAVSRFTPANCSGVVPVAALTRYGARAGYSNYGNIIQLSAPGGDTSSDDADGILSTVDNGLTSPLSDGYAYYQGTSMAAPHVAGVVALMLAKNSALTPTQVSGRLRAATRPFVANCTGCGAGMLDANYAVQAAMASSRPDTEPNDSIATAVPITITNAAVAGTMATDEDVDVFSYSVPVGRTLRAAMAPALGSRDFDLAIFDQNGNELALSEEPAGLTDVATYTNSGPSLKTVYVTVYYFSGGPGSYTLTMKR